MILEIGGELGKFAEEDKKQALSDIKKIEVHWLKLLSNKITETKLYIVLLTCWNLLSVCEPFFTVII